MPSLQALKDAVRGQVEQTYVNQSRFKLKRALLDALDTAHDFPLPPRMVEAEFGQIVVPGGKRQGPGRAVRRGYRQVRGRAEGRLPQDRRAPRAPGLVLARSARRTT